MAGAKKAVAKKAGTKTAGYKLATYKSSDGPRAGLVIGEEVFDAAKLTGKPAYATVLGILADWKRAEAVLNHGSASSGTAASFAEMIGSPINGHVTPIRRLRHETAPS